MKISTLFLGLIVGAGMTFSAHADSALAQLVLDTAEDILGQSETEVESHCADLETEAEIAACRLGEDPRSDLEGSLD